MKRKNIILFTLFLFTCGYLSAGNVVSEVVIAAPEASEEVVTLSDSAKPYSREFYKSFITAAYYEEQGKNKDAFEIYEKLYKLTPDEEAILSSLAGLSLNIQNKEAMEKYIPAYYAFAPENAEAMAMQAGLLWSRGSLKDAAELYKTALEKAPDNVEIITRYVTLLSVLDGDEAIKYLRLLCKQYPGMGPLIAVNIADLYLKQGDKASALQALKDYIARNPDAPEPYSALASIYESTGESQNALNTYLAMEKEGLASADILVKIGAYYTLADNKAESLEYFRRAKALDKSQPAAAQFLVLDAQSRGDYDNAVKFLQESSAYEKEPSFHIRASYFLSRAGKRAESADLLADAYAKFPDDKEIGFYYALALTDAQEYRKAEKIFASILETSPKNESALFHYAFTLERQKKYKKMEKQLKTLLEINPKNSDALNYYGYYLVDKTRRIDEGGEYIKSALAIVPDDAAFIDSMAWYYYKKGEYEQAYDLLSSIPLSKLTEVNDTEIYLHLGQISQALGYYEAAVDYYNIVIEADPSNKTALKNLKKVTKKIKS